MARSLAARVHDKARNTALKELKEMHEDEFEQLFESARKRIEHEMGYVDRRPEANRKRYAKKVP